MSETLRQATGDSLENPKNFSHYSLWECLGVRFLFTGTLCDNKAGGTHGTYRLCSFRRSFRNGA